MKKYLLLVVISITIPVLGQKNTVLPSIDLEDAFTKKHEIKISTLAAKVEYVPLETTPESILDGYRFFAVTNKYIIYRCMHKILLFDRFTGKFIKEIGKSGRGPNEYDWIPGTDFYNYESQKIYAFGTAGKELLAYDLNGNMIEKFKLPVWEEPTARNKILQADYSTYFDDKTFAFNVINEFGLANDNLVLYSKDGVIKKFPNYIKMKNEYSNKQRGVATICDEFMRWESKLFYKDHLNDTLFQVTKNALIPRLVFNAGKYKFPNGLQFQIYANRDYKKFFNYFFVTRMFENNKYIFFCLAYDDTEFTGIFDKQFKKVEICNSQKGLYTGLYDDLNGFIPIVPLSITPENEILTAFDGLTIKKWIEENPEKAKTAEKKLPWLKNYSELNNPVVVIAKCK